VTTAGGTATGARLWVRGGEGQLGGGQNRGGNADLLGGDGVVAGYDGGNVTIQGGWSNGQQGGNILIFSGDSVSGPAGDITVDTGTAATQGVINIGITNALEVNVGRAAGSIGFYGVAAVGQSAAYTRSLAVVEDRTLLASAGATNTNNNNVLAALIGDLQALGLFG
jgi:hypothetical protein